MSDQISTKKSLGQHWLHDDASLRAMCDAATVSHRDVILEVGPGTGTLTKKLLELGARVVAVELDERLASQLKLDFANQPFELHLESILEFDLSSLPKNYKLVANIPYYLTSHLIRVVSESSNPPSVAALLVQKEVAERLAAEPGQMSILSVSAQYYWQVKLDQVVKADLFNPVPKVDSQIVILSRRPTPLFDGVDEKQFFRVVKAGFGAKRKTLLNSLSGGLGKSKTEVNELLDAAGIDPSARAQALSLDDWNNLYQVATHLGLLLPYSADE